MEKESQNIPWTQSEGVHTTTYQDQVLVYNDFLSFLLLFALD